MRAFSSYGTRIVAGTDLSRDDLLAMPPANYNSLQGSGHFVPWPMPPAAPEQPPGERFLVARGGGRFDVIEGRKLTDEPLSKADAESLAASGTH